ncbi:YciI family protein [Chelatococcus reniformis]|nr:YciI family protein [Chelatococcus reniformis]
MVEAADLDAAIALARRVPLTRDGAVEIRPLLTPPGEASPSASA